MITPVLHRIMVKQVKLEEVHKEYQSAKRAGIIIPEHPDTQRAQAGVDRGTVVAIGETAYRDYSQYADPDSNIPVHVGDTVAFAKYSGKVVTDPETDEEYVILNDEDIVCVITQKD